MSSRSSPGSKAREQHFRRKEQHLQSPHQSQGKKIRFYRLSSHSGEKNAFPMTVLLWGFYLPHDRWDFYLPHDKCLGKRMTLQVAVTHSSGLRRTLHSGIGLGYQSAGNTKSNPTKSLPHEAPRVVTLMEVPQAPRKCTYHRVQRFTQIMA